MVGMCYASGQWLVTTEDIGQREATTRHTVQDLVDTREVGQWMLIENLGIWCVLVDALNYRHRKWQEQSEFLGRVWTHDNQ